MIEKPDTFHTSDYGLAAFLLARGFELHRTEPSRNEIIFYFKSSVQLLTALSDYSSNAPVACRDYFHALRKAKALIREQNDNCKRRNR